MMRTNGDVDQSWVIYRHVFVLYSTFRDCVLRFQSTNIKGMKLMVFFSLLHSDQMQLLLLFPIHFSMIFFLNLIKANTFLHYNFDVLMKSFNFHQVQWFSEWKMKNNENE